jgi:hypothetical protein
MAQPQLVQIALDSGGHNAIGGRSLARADSAGHQRRRVHRLEAHPF